MGSHNEHLTHTIYHSLSTSQSLSWQYISCIGLVLLSATVRSSVNKEVSLTPAPVTPNTLVSIEFEAVSREIKLLETYGKSSFISNSD